VEDIAISKFKATCLEVLTRVQRTRKPVRVTRFGRVVAEVVPVSVRSRESGRLGTMPSSVRIKGDIVRPAAEKRDWEALG
jgi:prevent-host-death family protein